MAMAHFDSSTIEELIDVQRPLNNNQKRQIGLHRPIAHAVKNTQEAMLLRRRQKKPVKPQTLQPNRQTKKNNNYDDLHILTC